MGGMQRSYPSRPDGGHDHARCVTAALREAESVCSARGVNLTPTRKRVLKMVWQGHQPVKAYELIENFGGQNQPAKPPTVYRALDFLVENGLVHRIESQNAFIGCPQPLEGHAATFFICTDCQAVAELDSEGVAAAISGLAAARGFKVERKTIEVYGLCSACLGGQKK